jgi:DNA-binding FadR family transcriptional regulator
MIATLDRLQDTIHLIALNVLRKDGQRIHVSYVDHEAIFDRICRKDTDEARKRMHEHLEFGKRILVM